MKIGKPEKIDVILAIVVGSFLALFANWIAGLIIAVVILSIHPTGKDR